MSAVVGFAAAVGARDREIAAVNLCREMLQCSSFGRELRLCPCCWLQIHNLFTVELEIQRAFLALRKGSKLNLYSLLAVPSECKLRALILRSFIW